MSRQEPGHLCSGYSMCDGIVVKSGLVSVDCISVSVILFYFKLSTNSIPIHIFLYLIQIQTTFQYPLNQHTPPIRMNGTERAIIIEPHRKTAHQWKGAVQRYAKHKEKATVLV